MSAPSREGKPPIHELATTDGLGVPPDGSYTYRSDIPHPPKPAFVDSPSARAAWQKNMLAILLDGRGEDELMKHPLRLPATRDQVVSGRFCSARQFDF